MTRIISFDTETYYDKEVTIKTLGNYAYTRHPDFYCYMISVYDGEESWVGAPEDFNWDALDDTIVLSHNAGFDQEVYFSMVERGEVPQIKPLEWHCTAAMSAYVFGCRSLADAARAAYDVKLSKGMRDYMKGKHWFDVVEEDPENAAKMVEYADLDAVWCWKLYNDFGHLWPEHERILSRLTIDQGKSGVRIDTKQLLRQRKMLEQGLRDTEAKLPWMDKGRKPTSPIGMAEQCREVGISVPPTKTDDADGFQEWFDKYKDVYEWVPAIGEHRSINKVLKTIDTMHARLRDDETMESPLKYFGAHTGRWSGESGVNFQNFRKDPLVAAGEEIDIRRLIIPRPGHKFVICDLAQIEPRVLAWITGDEKMMTLIRSGMSVYEAFARSNGYWDKKGDLKKTDPSFYAYMKVCVLGLGYGAGHVKFQSMAAMLSGGDVVLTPEEAEATVKEFRRKNDRIVDLWQDLDLQFRRSKDSDFCIELPSGREMNYKRVRLQLRTFDDPDSDAKVTKRVWTALVGPIRKILYGGLLTENLVQATARDVFAFHLLRLHEEGIYVPFTVHDEAICEVPEDFDKNKIVGIMSETPPWIPGLPVGAEATEAMFYKK